MAWRYFDYSLGVLSGAHKWDVNFIMLAENGIIRLNSQTLKHDKLNQTYGTIFLMGIILNSWDLFVMLRWFPPPWKL